MQCNTDNRAIDCITIKDGNRTPNPMEVKDKNKSYVLKIETCIMERNVGSVEVINIHKLNALQRMNHAITAK